MARKRRKRRGDAAATEAPVEVAEREAPAAAADSATPRKTSRRRGGDVTAEQEESAAVQAPGPADSGKGSTDGEGKKPRLNKQKRNKTDKTPRASASDADADADAAATVKSGDDCTDGEGVPGDAEVSMSPRNGNDPNCPEVNIGEKGTTEMKKLKRRRRQKKNMQEQSPSAVSDANALEVDKSRTGCKDVPEDDKTVRSPRNEEAPGFSSVEMVEQEIQERKKKHRHRKRKNNKQEQSPSAVADADAVVVGKSGNDFTDRKGVPGVADVSTSLRNGEDQDCPEVNIAEKDIPERKKSKNKKPKENKQERSPATVSDDGSVQSHKSGIVCTNGDVASGDAQLSMSTRNVEDPYCPGVNIAEKGTHEREKAKPKKQKNKKEGTSSVVLDAGAVVADESGNGCTDGDGAPQDIEASICPRNVENPYCPEVNIAEETHEIEKAKPKKRKKKKKGSSSVVLDAGAVVEDESGNGCTDGDGATQDIEASIFPRNGDDPNCPELNNAEKGIAETYKTKLKKRKKNNQEQSPSAVLDAGDVVANKSGHDSTNVGAASEGADVTMCPRIGEDPEYPKLNATGDLLEGNKVNKDYSQKPKLKKQMKNKHDQSPSAVLDTCAVVEDKSGKSYIDEKGSVGDTEIDMSPSNGKDHDCPEVNIANDLVEGKNGNNDNSQKPKNKKRRRKKRATVAVTENVSSDERKDVSRTGSMKVTDKSDIISMTSTSGENHKENVQDIYSPEGSLVRFQRKKLLILDLNGILADINTDRHVSHMADGRVRGKNVFKRDYLDDFLRFCFENFELGIWSSRMKVNVDAVVDILMKDLRRHLVFCWDVSKCTTTKCATLENNRKPLVLKELKKLWNKEDPDLPWKRGEFSPSNTLLVDDSPYKALRNPPYTAIFPQSYSYSLDMEEDDSLGPGGDLRMYLENIAAADDVQRYVQEHPFGQPSITDSDPHWDFYAKIHERLDRCAGRKS